MDSYHIFCSLNNIDSSIDPTDAIINKYREYLLKQLDDEKRASDECDKRSRRFNTNNTKS